VYGGLARSKINEYSNAKTLLSGVALAFFTFLAAQYALEPIAWFPVRLYFHPSPPEIKHLSDHYRKRLWQQSFHVSVSVYWNLHGQNSSTIGECVLGWN